MTEILKTIFYTGIEGTIGYSVDAGSFHENYKRNAVTTHD